MAREVSSDFLRIDLTDGKTRKVISACQSDTIQRTLHFLVVNAGKPLDLTNLFYAEIIVKRTDGTYLDNACVIDGNDIQYTLKSTDVAVIGENEAHLLLSFKDGTVKETPTFYLNVFSTFYNPSAIQSQSEYTALVNKVLDAQEAANDALESKNAAIAAATDAADSADEAGSYVETVSLYTSEAGSHASTAENYASEAESILASASNVASEVEAVSEYMSTTSEYLESASEYASEAQSHASDVGGYIASASEYASTAASEADKGSGYITSVSDVGSEYVASMSAAESEITGAMNSVVNEISSTATDFLTSTSEYASTAASEASVANSCAIAAEAAMSGKVSKAGDTMTGTLTASDVIATLIRNSNSDISLKTSTGTTTVNSILRNIGRSDGTVLQYTGNLNDITVTSLYNVDGSSVYNCPNTSWGFVLTYIHANGSHWITQIWFDMTVTKCRMYMRNKMNGVWKDWVSDNLTSDISSITSSTLNGAMKHSITKSGAITHIQTVFTPQSQIAAGTTLLTVPAAFRNEINKYITFFGITLDDTRTLKRFSLYYGNGALYSDETLLAGVPYLVDFTFNNDLF